MILLLTLLLVGSISGTFGGKIHYLQPRIVNGENVTLGEMPFLVSLQHINPKKVKNHHSCGGSIINENYVLTAAHCLDGKNMKEFIVVGDTVDLDKPNNVERFPEKFIMHEAYNPTDSHVNDIALVKVDRPFEFSDTIAPISLAGPDMVLNDGQMLTVSGYGRTDKTEKGSRQMLKSIVPLISNKDCNQIYEKIISKKRNFLLSLLFRHKERKIYDTQICTLNTEARKGSCKGDSGGPLTYDNTLVGIVSWSGGGGCVSTEYPSVLTRVSKYIDWIHEHAL